MKDKQNCCPSCHSKAYVYKGHANADIGTYWQIFGKHTFKCTKRGKEWQYGYMYSNYITKSMKI